MRMFRISLYDHQQSEKVDRRPSSRRNLRCCWLHAAIGSHDARPHVVVRRVCVKGGNKCLTEAFSVRNLTLIFVFSFRGYVRVIDCYLKRTIAAADDDGGGEKKRGPTTKSGRKRDHRKGAMHGWRTPMVLHDMISKAIATYLGKKVRLDPGGVLLLKDPTICVCFHCRPSSQTLFAFTCHLS